MIVTVDTLIAKFLMENNDCDSFSLEALEEIIAYYDNDNNTDIMKELTEFDPETIVKEWAEYGQSNEYNEYGSSELSLGTHTDLISELQEYIDNMKPNNEVSVKMLNNGNFLAHYPID